MDCGTAVHDYEGVNLRLIWEIIDGDLPELRQVLAGI
nr:HepT-like ribonuclease domain-containing protein [uncultured Oscillibacter sp.]